jgi:Gpi18-like mannosyltransferase
MIKKWYKHDIMIAVVFVLISRLYYFVYAIYWNRSHLTSDSIFSLLNTWDAHWYHSIVLNGYMYEPFLQPRGDGANWAFFPLYPLVVRGFSTLSGIDAKTAGVFLSSLFLIVAIVYAMRYLVLTRSGVEPVTIAFLLAFGPYSFYFSSLYTEAMFIMLVAISFYFIEKRQWLACGVSGALLTAVRPTGIFIIFVLS